MVENKRLREASGEVNSDDPLVDVLYTLMRDHLPAGEVEKLVRDVTHPLIAKKRCYTNGWLALYAKDLAERIRSATPDPIQGN